MLSKTGHFYIKKFQLLNRVFHLPTTHFLCDGGRPLDHFVLLLTDNCFYTKNSKH